MRTLHNLPQAVQDARRYLEQTTAQLASTTPEATGPEAGADTTPIRVGVALKAVAAAIVGEDWQTVLVIAAAMANPADVDFSSLLDGAEADGDTLGAADGGFSVTDAAALVVEGLAIIDAGPLYAYEGATLWHRSGKMLRLLEQVDDEVWLADIIHAPNGPETFAAPIELDRHDLALCWPTADRLQK